MRSWGGNSLWSLNFKKALRGSEIEDYEGLLTVLTDVSICCKEEDRRVQARNPSGEFTVKED